MKKILLGLVVMLVTLLGLAAPMVLAEPIPLPTDINIAILPDQLPAEIRMFFGPSGKWKGSAEVLGMGRLFEVVLITERENKIIWARGFSSLFRNSGQYERLDVNFSNRKGRTEMIFPFPTLYDSRAEVHMWIEKRNTMKGEMTYISSRGALTMIFNLQPIL